MGLRLGLGGSSGCRLRSLGSQGMRSGTLAVPRAEVRGYAHNTRCWAVSVGQSDCPARGCLSIFVCMCTPVSFMCGP